MRGLRRQAIIVVLCTLGCGLTDGLLAQPVRRQTNDRDADLIAALIRKGRFDDARSVCDAASRGVDPQSDTKAKWAIRQTQVRTARAMTEDQFDEAAVLAARKPMTDLLQSYPNHRRRIFLEAEAARVRRESAKHSVLRAAITSTRGEARDLAVKRLLRATRDLRDVSDRVGDARSRLELSRSGRDFAMADDLIRLQQELQVDVVSLALMQTELFADGSDDCIAAATKAEQAAEDAIAALPADTAARQEVERLRVEAIFRADQLARAESQLTDYLRRRSSAVAPQVLALQTRIDLARDRIDEAESRLTEFYGTSAVAAPRSIEMDLARLEFLLKADRRQDVGPWLETIERRGGAYARRRAEAVALNHLRGDEKHAGEMVDASLIAAQGKDWLRRGDPSRAGDLLAAAAAAESDSERAIERAREAAAALLAAERHADAAQVLEQTALEHFASSSAAATHLQAMFLIASTNRSVDRERLMDMLRSSLRRWPAGDSASASRQWLAKLMVEDNRLIEAAEVATEITVDDLNVENLDSAIELWRDAFRSNRGQAYDDVARRFQAALAPLVDHPLASDAYRLASAALVDRDALSKLTSHPVDRNGPGDPQERDFLNWLWNLRRGESSAGDVKPIPPGWRDDAVWRLMRDGRNDSSVRAEVTRVLDQWDREAEPSLQRAERILWSGETEEAVAMIRQVVRQAPNAKAAIQQAASLLQFNGSRAAHQSAIALWDSLAAGSPQGSPTWHEAKLAAIKLLRETGDFDEADRRARYVLLTMPSVSQELQARYRSQIQ